MDKSLGQLSSLRVADAMSPHVIEVSANETMVAAAEIFLKHSISGAPVVDEVGRCVGVLSARDFLRQQCSSDTISSGPLQTRQKLKHEGPGESFQIETRSEDLVSHFMYPAAQGIVPEAPLLEAARVMCAAHIHRLPVLDPGGRAVGMITSLDIVAAMLRACEASPGR